MQVELGFNVVAEGRPAAGNAPKAASGGGPANIADASSPLGHPDQNASQPLSTSQPHHTLDMEMCSADLRDKLLAGLHPDPRPADPVTSMPLLPEDGLSPQTENLPDASPRGVSASDLPGSPRGALASIRAHLTEGMVPTSMQHGSRPLDASSRNGAVAPLRMGLPLQASDLIGQDDGPGNGPDDQLQGSGSMDATTLLARPKRILPEGGPSPYLPLQKAVVEDDEDVPISDVDSEDTHSVHGGDDPNDEINNNILAAAQKGPNGKARMKSLSMLYDRTPVQQKAANRRTNSVALTEDSAYLTIMSLLKDSQTDRRTAAVAEPGPEGASRLPDGVVNAEAAYSVINDLMHENADPAEVCPFPDAEGERCDDTLLCQYHEGSCPGVASVNVSMTVECCHQRREANQTSLMAAVIALYVCRWLKQVHGKK